MYRKTKLIVGDFIHRGTDMLKDLKENIKTLSHYYLHLFGGRGGGGTSAGGRAV